MVSTKSVCAREKDPQHSPSPEPFREPEGMMNVDLNCGEYNIPDLKKQKIANARKKKKLKTTKLIGYVILIIFLGTLAFLTALYINQKFHFFRVTPLKSKLVTNSIKTTTEKYEPPKQHKTDQQETFLNALGKNNKWIQEPKNLLEFKLNIANKKNKNNIFKQKLKNSSFLEDFQFKLSLCKLSQNLKDCCDIFSETELFDVLELCTVSDVLDVLIDYEENTDIKLRKRRQVYPPEDAYPDEYNFPQDNDYYGFNYENNPPPNENLYEGNQAMYPENYNLPYSEVSNNFETYTQPTNTHNIVDDKNKQQSPLEVVWKDEDLQPSTISPDVRNFHNTDEENFRIELPIKEEHTHRETINVNQIPYENFDLSLPEKKAHVQIDRPVQDERKINKTKIVSNLPSANIQSKYLNPTLSRNNQDGSLSDSKISANVPPNLKNNSDESVKRKELLPPKKIKTEPPPPCLGSKCETTKSEERANSDNIDFRSKQKLNVFASEDVQANQQSLFNTCYYPYPSYPPYPPYPSYPTMYKGFQQFDNSQLLKVVPPSQPKQVPIQPPIYMVNPPMYSFVPPQSPYVQAYAPSASNNPLSASVQVTGSNGQYYMCTPIPTPTNTVVNSPNIASFPGTEIRNLEQISPNMQDLMENVDVPNLSNSTRASIDCPIGEQSCADESKCIKIQQFCDNEVQCNDASDEMPCSCRNRIGLIRLCDGYFDCPNGEDEQGCFGCGDNEFSCDDWSRFKRSTCIPMEQRCDNIRHCEVTGKDEEDCSILTDNVGVRSQFKISNSVGFLHRNYKGKWYPTCFGTELWATDVCKTEAGPSSIRPRSHMMLTTDAYNGEYLNILANNEMNVVDTCLQNRAAFVECPPLYCGMRLMVKNPYRREEVETDAEDMLDNFERENSLRLDIPVANEQNSNDTDDFLGAKRVVGGKPSQPAAWPWIVSVFKNGIFHCGGVIINELWVVTAAHCADRYWQYYYEVQAGMLRRFSYSPMEQTRYVTAAIAHPDYDKSTLKNDIALMKLSSPVRYNRYVRPICLPSETTAGRDYLQGPAPGTICTTVGWGAIVEHGSDPDHMREVEIPVLSKCKHREDQDGDEICAGLSEGGKDACQGDSGGPFMCRNPNNPSQWYLAGIVSHGEGCARPNEPGVYTKVSNFIGWIAENTREDKIFLRVPLQFCPGYICTGTNTCLPKKRRCDKIVDCILGDDEQQCEDRFHEFFKQSRDNIMLLGDNNNASNIETDHQLINDSPEGTEAVVGSIFPNIVATKLEIESGGATAIRTESRKYFKCERMLQIIPISKRCDKVIDCEDGSDEENCLCIDYIRHNNPKAICDGITDCWDESDETDCVECHVDQFHCRISRKCIPLIKSCDGKWDCENGEDEWYCNAVVNKNQIMLIDKDGKPESQPVGVVVINKNGVWDIFCSNETTPNEAQVALRTCNSLGYHDYTEFHIHLQSNGTKRTINPTHSKYLKVNRNEYCKGIVLACDLTFLDPASNKMFDPNVTDAQLYLAPWNAAIYINGVYKCMGVLLHDKWIIATSHCDSNLANLKDSYVVAVLGKGKADLNAPGPYETILRVVEAKVLEKTEIVLLRIMKIRFNRYIKPIYLNVRRDSIFEEKCIAVGMENAKAVYVSLKALKNCAKGFRCFNGIHRENCRNENVSWSGIVVCDSRNGWYPAAVFHSSTGKCGMGNLNRFQSIMYHKYKLTNIMQGKAEFDVPPPHCDGFRCEMGECLHRNKICDGIPDCRNGEDEDAQQCYNSEMECHLHNECNCSVGEMKCKNNKCVKKESFCDRQNDCGDFEDEPDKCYCRYYLELTNPQRICDGTINCMDRSDEDPLLCPCNERTSVKCANSGKCVSEEMMCDGVEDCPHGEDEDICVSLKLFPDRNNAGEVLTQTAGVWHSGCFNENQTSEELTEICDELGYPSSNAKKLAMPVYESNVTALLPVIDQFSAVWIRRTVGNKLNLKLRTGNDPYITFRPGKECFRLFVECS